MEDIYESIDLRPTTVVFAPHHGRKSGKLPDKWLDKLKPKIIVIGEAEQRQLQYYGGYHELTQTKAWDITFEANGGSVHCYASNPSYGKRAWLTDEGLSSKHFGKENLDYYIGSLDV